MCIRDRADLNKGDVSGLVTSTYGIHIIQCTDVFEAPEELTSLDVYKRQEPECCEVDRP